MDASPDNNRFMDYLLFRSWKGDTTPAEQAKVGEWRQLTAANESYYRELGRLLDLSADAFGARGDEAGPPPDGVNLIRSAGKRDRNGRHGGRPRWTWFLTGAMGAAAASVALMLALTAGPDPAPDLLSLGVDEFATGSNDVATVQLRDGTVVRLAPQSRLRLTGSTDEREVTLDGRAYFAVAEMEGHRFTVKTRGGDAVVLGTRFEADARGEALRVLVVEGRVALAAAGSRVELGAGEMARAAEGAVSAPIAVPDPEKSIDWVGGFLVFQGAPIEQVAEKIRAHFDVEVVLVGEELNEHAVTAWFADPTLDDVVRVVCKVLAADCSSGDGTITIDVTPENARRRTLP